MKWTTHSLCINFVAPWCPGNWRLMPTVQADQPIGIQRSRSPGRWYLPCEPALISVARRCRPAFGTREISIGLPRQECTQSRAVALNLQSAQTPPGLQFSTIALTSTSCVSLHYLFSSKLPAKKWYYPPQPET